MSTQIFLESKVHSVLTERQLRDYRRDGAKILVAVTKNRPEVSLKKIQEIGANLLRWQDFCRALRESSIEGQRERFICQSFAEYLEKSGMAHRENITEQDLDDVATLFKKITLPGSEVKVKKGFAYANNCLELLGDVRAAVLELEPDLDDWTRWGPGYFNWVSDKDEMYHYLAFSFPRDKWRTGQPQFRAGLCFQPKGISWEIFFNNPTKEPEEVPHSIYSISSPRKSPSGKTVRALDAGKMAEKVVKAARDWHIV